MTQGTPKSLNDAIVRLITQVTGNNYRQRCHDLLREYIAQRFGAAMLEHPEHKDMLEKLFKEIVGE